MAAIRQIFALVMIAASLAARASEDALEPIFSPAPKTLVAFIRDREDIAEFLSDGSTVIEAWKIDLNSDNTPEYIVQARGSICGAANCPMWVVERSGSSYSVLLETGSIQTLHVLSGTNNGYRNVVTRWHGSATSSMEILYGFSRGKYRQIKCEMVDYEILNDRGETVELETPQRTVCR